METYEEWDVSIPSIPPRSRLYRLEPIGIGTPYVESLTSYVARLALAHCVTPKALIMKVILPLQGKVDASRNFYFRLNKFWYDGASTLNGVGSAASEWVDSLQTLTGVPQLRFLTMLTFLEVIAVGGLLRRSKAWCPLCYEEWRCHRQVLYEPLLWSLSSIDICLYHQQPLMMQCPRCSKTIPFLTQTMRPGYCPCCVSFLGKFQKQPEKNERADTEWLYWKATVTGDLLATASCLSTPPQREDIASRLHAFVDGYAAGNVSALARFLEMTIQVLWGYLRQENVPSFDTLLKMCHSFSLTPGEFLTTTRESPLIQEKRCLPLESLPVLSRGKREQVTEEDLQRMRQTLEAVIAVDDQADQSPCLAEIARRMGFHVATIQKHCPDLSQAIILRHKRHWGEEEHRTKIKQALEMSLAKPVPESLEDLARQLHCNAMTLRMHFPDLCRAIVLRYRERFDYGRIEQKLREVLASDEEVPSVYEIAREMGYERHILRDKFADLCHQISTRRHAERKKRRQVRMASDSEKVRQTVLHLHEQKIYPSARQVFNAIGNQHILRSEEGYNAWLLALQELGYPTDTFQK